LFPTPSPSPLRKEGSKYKHFWSFQNSFQLKVSESQQQRGEGIYGRSSLYASPNQWGTVSEKEAYNEADLSFIGME
jgi:hypothetical protein